MLRILVITNTTREDIAKIIAYAKKRENWYDGRDRSEGWLDRLPGHNLNLHYKIEQGYQCVFSYTYDSERHQVYRQLSISVPGGAYPAPEAVFEISRLFGYTGDVTNPDRGFPDDWAIRVNKGGQIDDRCIVVMQEVPEAEVA